MNSPPRCDYNLCRPCYEGNLVFEALEDVEEDVEYGAAAALTLVPEDAEAEEEPPAFCVVKKESEASSSQCWE